MSKDELYEWRKPTSLSKVRDGQSARVEWPREKDVNDFRLGVIQIEKEKLELKPRYYFRYGQDPSDRFQIKQTNQVEVLVSD